MADPTKIQHPLLRRPGTSQRKRLDAATWLSPARAPVDGRTLGDMLDFVHQYARQLVFHAAKTDDQGQPYVELSNWLDFFEHSLPFILNRFSKTDFDKLEADLQAVGDALERDPGEANLRLLLDLAYFDLIDPVERFQQHTREFAFESLVMLLDHRARTALLPPLRRFIELSNAAATYFCFGKLEFLRFSEPPWEIPFDEIFQTDESFTRAPGGRDGATAWLGAEVTKAARRFLKAQRAIADELPGFLGDSIAVLEKRHEPHLGLLFAFLRLFEHFQGDLNALTQKHLDFFYADVLRLKRRQMEPDQVHLIFEPAKHLPTHLIEKGTLFKDAKDDNNIDILFGLDEQIVIDKAKVVSLKTLYLDRSLGALEGGGGNAPKQFVHGLYAAPVANSADGEGKAFAEEASKNFATLGAKQSKFTRPGQQAPADHPFARLGFVLASQVLWLNEGHREISISIDCDVGAYMEEYRAFFDQCCAEQWLGAFKPATIYTITQNKIDDVERQLLSTRAHAFLSKEFSRKSILQFQEDGDATWGDFLENDNFSGNDQKILFALAKHKESSTPQERNKPERLKKVDYLAFVEDTNSLLRWLKLKKEWQFINLDPDEISALIVQAVGKTLPFAAANVSVSSFFESRQVYSLDISSFLTLRFSGEVDWFAPASLQALLLSNSQTPSARLELFITATVESDQPKLAFYKEAALKEKLHTDCSWPMAKIELKPEIKLRCATGISGSNCCLLKKSQPEPFAVDLYHLFRFLRVQKTDIRVDVEGLKNVIVQNEESLQDVDSLIYPFGARPRLHSEFYVGSKELLCKAWQEFSLNVEWKDIPANGFENHYENYTKYDIELEREEKPDESIKDDLFKVDRDVLEDGKWLYLDESLSLEDKVPLFPDSQGPSSYSYGFSLSDMPTGYEHTFKPFDDSPLRRLTVDFRDAFLRLKLRGASFQHLIYPFVLGRYLMALALILEESTVGEIEDKADKAIALHDTIRTKINNVKEVVEAVQAALKTTKRKLHRLSNPLKEGKSALEGIQSALFDAVEALDILLDVAVAHLTEGEVEEAVKKLECAKKIIADHIFPYITEGGSGLGGEVANIPGLSKGCGKWISAFEKAISELNSAPLEEAKTLLGNMLKEVEDGTEEGGELQRLNDTLKSIKAKTEHPGELPKEPYTPKIKSITVDYSARSEKVELIHLHPFAATTKATNWCNIDQDALSVYDVKCVAPAVLESAQRLSASTLYLSVEGLQLRIVIVDEKQQVIVDKAGSELHGEQAQQDLRELLSKCSFADELPEDAIDAIRSEVIALIRPTLLPSFTDEGSLFIGCEQLRPNANLSLLLQFAEATADTESQSAEITWQYLSDNRWKELRPGFELLSDGTEKLTRSGIVKIALPGDISNKGNTLMPPPEEGEPLFWLKVSAKRDVAGVAELLGVHAQAALATYEPKQGSDLDRVGEPLAPEQISKPLQPDFGIKSVEQLYKTFGGRVAEAEGATPARMAELLRHKNRSVDAFDIEHLVLDAFPELFKCKCIGHTMGLSARQYQRDLELAPGFLVVAVVPDLKKLDPGDLLEPRAPRSILGKVEQFLKARMSTFARVLVMNPRYEPIHVKIAVRLKPGVDKDYHLAQLKTDLGRLLSPWYLGDSDKLSFGQEVAYSDVLGFVEGLDYVEQVTCMRLYDFRSTPDAQPCESGGLKKIVPLTARSILTCAPANIHTWLHDPKCCEQREQHPEGDDPLRLLEARPQDRNGNPCADPADDAVDPDRSPASSTLA